MIGIYCFRNKVNGKVYIGKSLDLDRRIKEHYCLLHNNLDTSRLQTDFNVYGYSNFEISLIEECSIEHLDEREIYWISFYDARNPEKGYNKAKGGEGGCGHPMSLEARKKISEAAKRQHQNMTPEMRAQRSEAISKAGKGRKMTPEQCKKASERVKRSWQDPERRVKHSKALTGTHRTPEQRQRMSENVRKRIAEGNRDLTSYRTDEYRKKMSEAVKLAHARDKQTGSGIYSEECKQKRQALVGKIHRTEEQKQHLREMAKKQWAEASPEKRAKMTSGFAKGRQPRKNQY